MGSSSVRLNAYDERERKDAVDLVTGRQNLNCQVSGTDGARQTDGRVGRARSSLGSSGAMPEDAATA